MNVLGRVTRYVDWFFLDSIMKLRVTSIAMLLSLMGGCDVDAMYPHP